MRARGEVNEGWTTVGGVKKMKERCRWLYVEEEEEEEGGSVWHAR